MILMVVKIASRCVLKMGIFQLAMAMPQMEAISLRKVTYQKEVITQNVGMGASTKHICRIQKKDTILKVIILGLIHLSGTIVIGMSVGSLSTHNE